MKVKSATITEEQEEWLNKHKEINFSGLVQKTIDKLIEKDNEAHRTIEEQK